MLIYMIVCPLLFLAGFVDAIAGGGGLISLPAYMLAGLSPHYAVATNKMSSSMGTSVATFHYIRKGYVTWKLCIPAIITAFIGSTIGSNLNIYLEEKVLQIIILCILPFIAFYVMKNKNLENEERVKYPVIKTMVLCAMVSLVVGVYDGLYGPGTGTFLLLLFTAVCHRTLKDAAGMTKVINLTTNVVALVVFLINGNVLIPLGITAGVFNMAGNYIGSHCFSKKGSGFVKPIILVVLVIFFIKIIYDLML